MNKNPSNGLVYLEVVATDSQAASAYYESAFGWQFEQVAELGNAMVAEMPGGSLCGIREPLSDIETPIIRTYFQVPDLAEATSQARRSGATILLDQMEIPGRGQIAIFELCGIEQGVWQLPTSQEGAAS